jgi:hypothetical protein
VGLWRSELSRGIREQGFRKWYERELISSHAHLVLTFLCMIGVLAAFEAYERSAPVSDQIVDVLAILICTGVGIWALRRYLYLLLHAEATANQATCPGCQAYARFDLAGEVAGPEPAVLAVRCRKCQTGWEITR